MNKKHNVVIVSARRTPIGSFQGGLSVVSAPKLGSLVISEILNDTMLDPLLIDEVIMGNVLSAGLGQAPARQATIGAGLPDSIECLTINKMCASGLKAVMLAAQAIQINDANIIIAGGFENMSQAPYILPKARAGYRLGNGRLIDSMINDGYGMYIMIFIWVIVLRFVQEKEIIALMIKMILQKNRIVEQLMLKNQVRLQMKSYL